MFRRTTILAALPALAALGCSNEMEPAATETPSPAPTAESVLADVVAAMGTANLESISFEGWAWSIRNGFMQTPHADPPWPWRDAIRNYRRTIDLGAPASLAQGDTFQMNIFFDPPTAGTYVQNVPADQTSWAQQLEIWLTPWGFLEGAEANGVEMSTETMNGMQYTVLSWQSPADQTSPSGMRYTVNAYIGEDDLIRQTDTWVEHPFMGDFHVVQVYDDYRRFDGVMVPTEIEQRRGGGGVFGIEVSDASANPADLAALMVPPETSGGGFGGGGDTPENLVEELADGVWLVTGGYVALVAEFSDHLLVFEGGQSEARGEQIIAEIRENIGDKPIRYIVNSHPHSDHTAGLVPFLREGATLVTHTDNVEFLEMALSTPRTLLGEEPLNPQLEGVEGVGVYEDDTMRVELHSVPNGHTDGMLVAVVPEAGVLFQADFTLPSEGAQANPFVKTLASYVADNDVQFERYLAVHAANVPQTREDLLAAIE
jgi:glyoxylase-like metal-dependent hydrolase (beta-lactamase superfamily II)